MEIYLKLSILAYASGSGLILIDVRSWICEGSTSLVRTGMDNMSSLAEMKPCMQEYEILPT